MYMWRDFVLRVKKLRSQLIRKRARAKNEVNARIIEQVSK